MKRKKKTKSFSQYHSVGSNLALSETHYWFVNHAAKRDPVSHLCVTLGDMVISPLSLHCILIFLLC